MKYAVRLHSKYTGEETTLGSKYESREEAESWADDEKNICHRCNRVEIIPVHEDSYWVNRHDGFIGTFKRPSQATRLKEQAIAERVKALQMMREAEKMKRHHNKTTRS